MPSSPATPNSRRLKAIPAGLIALLALIALAGAAYLTYASLRHVAPPGCGAGNGCSDVLTSNWSRWLGMPVSLLAGITYAAILAMLPIVAGAASPARQRAAWMALLLLAGAIVAAAGWFISVQALIIRAWCIYCLAEHAVGLTLAGLIFWQAHLRRAPAGPLTRPAAATATLLGALGVGIVAAGQTLAPSSPSAQPIPVASADPTDTAGDHLILLSGRLALDPQAEPALGPADVPRRLALMLDYACPHCRRTHAALAEAIRTSATPFAVVLLPVPMNHRCNPHAPESMPQRFENSCQLARLALAVFRADRSQFADYDRWLFEPDQPRPLQAAHDEAQRRIGKQALSAALADPWVEQTLRRNIDAFSQSGADRVPVTLAPGYEPIIGAIDSPSDIQALLSPAAQP